MEPQESNSAGIALLIANERSGTHLLRSLIASTKLVLAPGEVCNAAADSAHMGDPSSYYCYRHNAATANRRLMYPTIGTMRELIDGFFATLKRQAEEKGKSLFLCDIKYSHIHTFNYFWWDWLSVPFLLQYARENKIPIIHLVRENVYETVLSEIYAHQTGVWRASDPGELVHKSIRVNVPAFKARAEKLQQVITLARGWLRDCHVKEIKYSDIVDQNSMSVMDETMKFIGFDGSFKFKPGFIKTTPPYETIVENYDEIRDFFT
ncbi:hypothetical protein GJ654_19355 [Rhodoblastus acidophilus]|uniref:Sulfotransferase family protein n=1 Tax=Rhodoblastus acidophilus TaxID=1074 RepID=A0A6N8DW90_RHOAC|nr:hypothetical protein [Rhodoblastus acidophilus]MCW2276427.1 LPS sulfotransferase NodH [Rhodoblastus acidophilus]MTV33144.1 hypothetical protein [Rhodoblastus acidophilus]